MTRLKYDVVGLNVAENLAKTNITITIQEKNHDLMFQDNWVTYDLQYN